MTSTTRRGFVGPLTTRRRFVGSLIKLGAFGGVSALSGCRLEDRPRGRVPTVPGGDDIGAGGAAVGPATPLTRPILRPWAEDIAWIATPSGELPAAYVSMARRHVYVDHDYRDRAAWLLNAHISVSTAHWRIPLPGDPEGQPITPGDERREFEEFGIHEWDPGQTPALDDIRIVRGRRTSRAVDFACVPMVGNGWYAAGPWTVDVASASTLGASRATADDRGEPESTAAEDTTREDFRVAGSGMRFDERACATGGEAVQYVMWSCRDAG